MKNPRFLIVLFTFLLVFTNWSFAAKVNLMYQTTSTGLVLKADVPIRFFVDYSARTIVIPDASLENPETLPNGVQAQLRADGLILVFANAFQVLLSGDGKLLTVTGGINNVALVNTNAPTTLNTESGTQIVFYRLLYANPSAVAALITQLYTVKVQIDERQRAVILVINPNDRKLFDALVKELDTPRAQVLYEVEILEVNQQLTQSLGIDYTNLFTFTFAEQIPVGIGLGAISRSPGSISFGINLLKESGAAKVLSRPRIMTMDGVEARLNATQTQNTLIAGQGGSKTVQSSTTGLNLRLMPRVNPDGSVESQVTITVSIPAGQNQDGGQQFSTRELNTTTRVRNAESLVLGGLYENRRQTAVSAVPLLSEIPILGELFKSTREVESTTDLVIMITPYILGFGDLPIAPTPIPAPELPGQ
jgi:general secretion pathway protein D